MAGPWRGRRVRLARARLLPPRLMLAGGAHDRQGLFLVLVGGAGFTLDELALWVYLDDVYWAEEAERAAR